MKFHSPTWVPPSKRRKTKFDQSSRGNKKRPGKGVLKQPAAAPSFGPMDELDTALVSVPLGRVTMPGPQNEIDEAEQGEEEEPLEDDAEDEDGNGNQKDVM